MEALRNIFVRFMKPGRGLVLVLTLFSCAFTGSGQQRGVANKASQAKVGKASDVPNQVAAPPASTNNPADDYKKSLNELLSLYSNNVKKLEQDNNQLKELYKDGIVARVTLEASDRALAEARAKSEAIQKQIIAADKPLVANVSEDSLTFTASEQSWSTGSAKVDNLIKYYGKKYAVDPYLVFCLMAQESSFSANAISPKGAQGLMQLMPATAARYGVTNPYDVAQSIMGGTRYLKDLLQMFNGRVDLALAGYNAGEGAVIKYGYNVPPYNETRNYVRLISMRYNKGKKPSVKHPS